MREKSLFKIFMIILILILPIVEARLSEEQVDQVVEKIAEVCKDNSMEAIKNYVNKWESNRSKTKPGESGHMSLTKTVELCENHTFRRDNNVYYLDDIDISTISQKIEIEQSVINSDVGGDLIQTANTGKNVNQIGKSENSEIEQNIKSKNQILTIGITLGVTIMLAFVLKWIFKIKIARKK